VIVVALLAVACSDFDRLRLRAWLGGADSQALVGFAYDTGRGVPVDKAAALEWYHRAAEQGHTKAMSLIGEKYQMGEGVAADPVQACMWYYLAASTGDDRARALMTAIERELSAEQVKEAYRRADAWRAER
jgi:hypothetical protein